MIKARLILRSLSRGSLSFVTKKKIGKKGELIEKASKLSEVTAIKEREKAARDLQKQWLDVAS